MIRRFAVCLLALHLLGCEGQTLPQAPAQGEDPRLAQLQAENAELRQESSELTEINEHQSELVEEYTGKLNEILDSLNAITGKQKEIEGLAQSAQGEFPTVRYDIDERIEQSLEEINERIEENRRLKAEIEKLADRPGPGQIAGLKENLQRLEKLLANKEEEIRALQARVSELELVSQELQAEVAEKEDQLQESRGRIDELEASLREAFYVVGTKRELRDLDRQGVLENRRGIYRAGPEVYRREDLRRRFQLTEPTADRIPLGARVRKPEIVSLHREYKRLYSFREEGGETFLVLRDPLEFWDVSKILVVRVDR